MATLQENVSQSSLPNINKTQHLTFVDSGLVKIVECNENLVTVILL